MSESYRTSLDTVASALAYAMGTDAPKLSAPANKTITEYIDKTLGGGKVDRIFMYNPDAIAEWIYRKYPTLTTELAKRCGVEVPLSAVMPSVTPVCFGTMYTGAQPEVHGIRAYEKPVIKIDTVFDALIRAGKRPVIVADKGSSLSKIYLERDMDYFFFDTVEEINAKAAEIIIEDKYDFVVVYNANYDTIMHKYGPESVEALSELRANAESYAMFDALIETHWKHHKTLLGFAMDHGAHEIDGGCGSHGLDMKEDIEILHLYTVK